MWDLNQLPGAFTVLFFLVWLTFIRFNIFIVSFPQSQDVPNENLFILNDVPKSRG